MSGALDNRAGLFSGPMEKGGSDAEADHFPRSFSHGGGIGYRSRSRKPSLIRVLKRAISKTRIYSCRGQNSMVAAIKNGTLVKEPDWILTSKKHNENLTVSSSDSLEEDDDVSPQQNLQWAQGRIFGSCGRCRQIFWRH